MNGKMRSSVMGLILGQFSSPLPMAQKEPVAYLYNGVRLPKLPEWDREMYPYVVITEFGLHIERTLYMAYALTKESYIKLEHSAAGNAMLRIYYDPPRLYTENENDAKTWYYTDYSLNEIVDDKWQLRATQTYENLTYDGQHRSRIVWSNHDIPNEDGTVYFAKCGDPIPVYE